MQVRRTQSLRGGVLETAPLHWDGELASLPSLLGEVMTNRMSAAPATDAQIELLARWLGTLPPPQRATPSDAAAVARGREIFTSAAAACATCHSGPHLTNNTTVDVGTGGAFQVPSLVGVAARAPYLHNGCAATLRDRFTPSCGGGEQHGRTADLTSAQLDDLVAYLETL